MYFFSVTLTIFLSDSGRRNPPCAPPGLHLHDARDDAPGGIPVQAELHTTLRLFYYTLGHILGAPPGIGRVRA